MSDLVPFVIYPGARIVPTNKTYSIEEGIQARLKDPLWMLGRQQQLHGFDAICGGQLVQIEAAYRCRTIDKMSPRGSNPVNFDVSCPLEKLVEEENSEDVAPAWNPKQLEYEFSIEDQEGKVKLTADYDGERLDWFSFDIEGTPNINSEPLKKIKVQPQPVRYSGMPAPGWTFEDGAVSLGDLDRPYLNFLTMILVEFALVYSEDWYMFPIRHNVGDLRVLEEVKLIDTFGFVTRAEPIKDETPDRSGFEIFSISREDNPMFSDPHYFYMPNNLWNSLESGPIELVHFLRDERANLVWAIEERVLAGGKSLDRHLAEASNSESDVIEPVHYWDTETSKLVEKPESFPEGEPGNKLLGPLAIYEQQHLPPRYWIPFVQQLRHNEVILRRARTYGDKDDPQYLGRFLNESKFIYEEEVPRSGITLSRIYQLARDTDGNQKAWLGRKKRPAIPHRSSDLSLDQMFERRE